jgi:hypothetical protein
VRCGPDPPPPDLGETVAVITRTRFGYTVDLRDDVTALNSPYWRPTRRLAEAKARRLLAREKREPESWTVTL